MFMHGDIDALIRFIAKHFTFDERSYPELAGASEEKRLLFALNHSALHFSKTAGKISAAVERAEHGKEIDVNELRENVPKALINTLRLAELVGMTEMDIMQAIEQKYGDRIDKEL